MVIYFNIAVWQIVELASKQDSKARRSMEKYKNFVANKINVNFVSGQVSFSFNLGKKSVIEIQEEELIDEDVNIAHQLAESLSTMESICEGDDFVAFKDEIILDNVEVENNDVVDLLLSDSDS